MKKSTIIFVAIMFLVTYANAQFKVGLQGNLLITNATLKEDDGNGGSVDIPGTTSSTGFKFGVIMQMPLATSLVFVPELNYVNKGIKQSQEVSFDFGGAPITSKIDNSASLNYIEMPLNLAYKSTTTSGSFFGGLGPVLSLGVSGRQKSTSGSSYAGISQDTIIDVSVKFDGKKDADVNDNKAHLKALEIGANFFAVYELKCGLFFKALYNTAFTNSNPNENNTYKPNYFGIGLGYIFGKNKTSSKSIK